jgi:hypothetical protein
MDWDWFFSSASQSVAAIVGLFGAFLVTKLIANQAEHRALIGKATDFINKAKILEFGARSRKIGWYNQRMRQEQLAAISAEIARTGRIRTSAEYYRDFPFSKLDRMEEAVIEIEQLLRLKRAEAADPNMVRRDFPRLDPEELREAKEEGAQIERLLNDSLHHTLGIEDLLRTVRSNPQYSNIVSVIIAAEILLFFSGIIFPLACMPYDLSKPLEVSAAALLGSLGGFKGAFLGVISAIFTALMLYFFGLNIGMRFSKAMVGQLVRYANLASYSPHFATMIANVKAREG